MALLSGSFSVQLQINWSEKSAADNGAQCAKGWAMQQTYNITIPHEIFYMICNYICLILVKVEFSKHSIKNYEQ